MRKTIVALLGRLTFRSVDLTPRARHGAKELRPWFAVTP
jgi:hypothetical protein